MSTEEKALVGSLNQIGHVIAVMSGKGGVGKSSISALLAAALARSGAKVGILDADITGPSQPRAFGVISPGLTGSQFGITPPVTSGGIKIMSINFFLPNEDDPVVWRGPMLSGAVKQFWEEVDWQDLDYMIVDLPPGTGDVSLTVLQTIPVDGLVIVSSPQDLAFMVVKKAVKMAGKMNISILGLVENMSYAVCPHCGEELKIFGESQGQSAAIDMGIDFLGRLPWDEKMNQLIDQGKAEDYHSLDIESITAMIKDKLMG